jgi:hypothetical protein
MVSAIAAVTITEENVPLLIVEPDNLLRSAQNVQRRRIAGGSSDLRPVTIRPLIG